MTFIYRRRYIGPLRAVILDWSGTTIDYGCYAPALVFVALFEAAGVSITMAQARAPMGAGKRDHIAQIMQMPAVTARWRDTHGADPTDADVQRMFDEYVPRQVAVSAQYAQLIPGTTEATAAFRARGLKIGTCTGYPHAVMEAVMAETTKQGYKPDTLVCSEDVPAGRPAPWMALQAAQNLGVYPLAALVKIGDTPPDIAEGLNAGMWTIGLAQTGNEIGLNEAELNALDTAERERRLSAACDTLQQAGAHYVVNSIGDVPAVLDEIETRLRHGDQP